MIDNPVYDDNLVRGSDLQPIIDQLNAQEVFVDDLTMISTESTAGKYLSVIDQYGGGGGGGGGGEVIGSVTPFLVSVNEQNVKVLGGKVVVRDYNGVSKDEYIMPEEIVDLSSITETSTQYLYLKVANDWTVGSTFINYPTMTVDVQNHYFNDSVFPKSDIDNFYYPIATLNITVVDEVKTIEISQIALSNAEIIGYQLHPWQTVMIFQGKTDDTDADTTYEVFVKGGRVDHPEGATIIPQYNITTGSIEAQEVYVNISSTEDPNGFKINFNATLSSLPSTPPSTSDNSYINVSKWISGVVSQIEISNIFSDGKVW